VPPQAALLGCSISPEQARLLRLDDACFGWGAPKVWDKDNDKSWDKEAGCPSLFLSDGKLWIDFNLYRFQAKGQIRWLLLDGFPEGFEEGV